MAAVIEYGQRGPRGLIQQGIQAAGGVGGIAARLGNLVWRNRKQVYKAAKRGLEGSGVQQGSMSRPRKRARRQSRAAAAPARGDNVFVLPNVRTGGLIHKELKFKDYNFSQYVGSTVATSDADPAVEGCISAVAQGDGAETRDGRRYMMRHLFLKGVITLTSAVASATIPQGVNVRLAVVQDTQTNGADASAPEVWKESGSDTANSFRNLEFTQRFRILKELRLSINRASLSALAGPNYYSCRVQKRFAINLKDLNILVNTKGTTASIASIADNSIHVFCWANGNANSVFLDYTARLRFHD